MKLTFCGKRPQQNFIRMGVVGNNLSDELIMILDKKQGDIDLSDFSPSLKIVNRDLTYADKTQHFIYDTDSDPEKVMLSYIFPRKVTQQGNVDMQIIFEKADGDDTIVWQTEIFNITFEERLEVDEIVADEYPDVLSDLDERVTVLEETGGGVTEYIDRDHFPDSGESNVLYIDASTNTPYRYDMATNKYYVVGLTADDIKIINANGGK